MPGVTVDVRGVVSDPTSVHLLFPGSRLMTYLESAGTQVMPLPFSGRDRFPLWIMIGGGFRLRVYPTEELGILIPV